MNYTTSYVVLGKKYAPIISHVVQDTIFYYGESVTYEEFANITQELVKNIFLDITIIFDISMVRDKQNLTGYFVWLRANFPKSRIILLAPNLDSPELISNAVSCGIYDLILDTIPTGASVNEEAQIIISTVQSAINNPKQFSDSYHLIKWYVPVLKSSQKVVKKGLFGKKKEVEVEYDDDDDEPLEYDGSYHNFAGYDDNNLYQNNDYGNSYNQPASQPYQQPQQQQYSNPQPQQFAQPQYPNQQPQQYPQQQYAPNNYQQPNQYQQNPNIPNQPVQYPNDFATPNGSVQYPNPNAWNKFKP